MKSKLLLNLKNKAKKFKFFNVKIFIGNNSWTKLF